MVTVTEEIAGKEDEYTKAGTLEDYEAGTEEDRDLLKIDKQKDQADEDLERYKEFLIHIRWLALRFQKQCEAPIGEVTFLLTIQQVCKKGGEICVSGLGEKLNLSRPAVSRMIHVLKRKGYIDCYPGKKDHRFLYIGITEEGKNLINREMERCMSLMRHVSEKMGKKDMEAFLYYGSKFYALISREI